MKYVWRKKSGSRQPIALFSMQPFFYTTWSRMKERVGVTSQDDEILTNSRNKQCNNNKIGTIKRRVNWLWHNNKFIFLNQETQVEFIGSIWIFFSNIKTITNRPIHVVNTICLYCDMDINLLRYHLIQVTSQKTGPSCSWSKYLRGWNSLKKI
jgi:hypothetical protein